MASTIFRAAPLTRLRQLSMIDTDTAPATADHDWWQPAEPVPRGTPRWTVLMAFYNEATDIVATLRQLRQQTRPFRLVLVDNGSTDHSVALCHSVLAGRGIDYVILSEAEVAGQTAAFAKGLPHVDTEFVATCDADTYYPAGYLAAAERLMDRGGPAIVAAAACFVSPGSGPVRATAMALHQCGAGWLLPRQTHVGAAGQCFRTDALQRAGGYSVRRWPWVLGDHEVMHRVLKLGRQRMSLDHWCGPSERRSVPVRWSLFERIAYHLTPFSMKDRYFAWLSRRFERRGLSAARLRAREWQPAGAL